MNDSHNKLISTFDEICHITIETMRKMDMETLLRLKKQAVRELDRARLTKGCINLVLSLFTERSGKSRARNKKKSDATHCDTLQRDATPRNATQRKNSKKNTRYRYR